MHMAILCNACAAEQRLPVVPRNHAAHCSVCGALLARAGVLGTNSAALAGLFGLLLIIAVLRLPWWQVSLAGGGSLACGLAETTGSAPGLVVLLLLGLSALQLALGCGGLLARQHPLGLASLHAAELLRPCMTTGLLLLAALLPLLGSWLWTSPLRIAAGTGIWALLALVACALLASRGLDEPAVVRAMAAGRRRRPRHLINALTGSLLLLIAGCAVLLWVTPVLASPLPMPGFAAGPSPLALAAIATGWTGWLGIALLAILLLALLLLATLQGLALLRQPGRRGRNRGGGLLIRCMLLPPLLLLLPAAMAGQLGMLPSTSLPIVWPLLGVGLAALALRALRERLQPRYTEAAL